MDQFTEVESWCPLPSGGGYYEVSTLGRVRSVSRVGSKLNRWGEVRPHMFHGRILKPWNDSGGYKVVYLCGDGRREAINVHRLIAEAFCAPVDGKDFVNHKDGDKTNNQPSNLEWCTRVENMAHAAETGLVPEVRKVDAISKDGAITLFFDSVKAAAISLGCESGRSNIRSALVGLIPTAYGFSWRYA